MNDSQRLEQAIRKMEQRKENLKTNGIPNQSTIGNTFRDFIAPGFSAAVGLAYKKDGVVILGETKPEDAKKLTSEFPVIYSPAHRGTFDAPRFIAYGVPHSYVVTGDERVFYCTLNEHLLDLNGIIYFDREDPKDSKLLIDRVSKVLESGSRFEKHHSVLLTPEGVPNVYGRENLKLYPGIIKMALNTGAVIVPIGNELNIIWDKEGKKIIGDTNYMMYENYKEQSLFRPSDDLYLAQMHNQFKNVDYIATVNNKDMEKYIHNNRFTIGNIDFNLEDSLMKFLETHPEVREFISQLRRMDGIDFEQVIDYLKRCTVIKELYNRQIESLNVLDSRMRVLSDKINAVIDLRHPKTKEERERDSREYINFYLDVVKKTGKKGPTNAEREIDCFINRTTEETIIASETKKVLEGLKLLLNQTSPSFRDHSYIMFGKQIA